MVKRTNLHKLHDKLAEILLDAMEHGEVREIEGVARVLTPSASLLNVARQFLKDNGIEGPPLSGKVLEAPKPKELPFKEPEEELPMVPDRDGDEF